MTYHAQVDQIATVLRKHGLYPIHHADPSLEGHPQRGFVFASPRLGCDVATVSYDFTTGRATSKLWREERRFSGLAERVLLPLGSIMEEKPDAFDDDTFHSLYRVNAVVARRMVRER